MLKKEGISENFGYCYIAKKKKFFLKASTPFITKNYPSPSPLKKERKKKKAHHIKKKIYILVFWDLKHQVT